MSVAESVRQVLGADTTDSNVSTVQAANSDFWASTGLVPLYAQKSLSTLWLSSTSTNTLINRINWNFGEGDYDPQGCISLFVQPMESALLNEPFMSQMAGAESAYLYIKFNQPEGEKSTYMMEQIELRVRYLLDTLWRAERGLGWIPISGDTSINADQGIYCQYKGYETPLNALEFAVRYQIAYQRNIPKG